MHWVVADPDPDPSNTRCRVLPASSATPVAKKMVAQGEIALATQDGTESERSK